MQLGGDPKHGRHYRRRQRHLACAGASSENEPVLDAFAATGYEFRLAACARLARLCRLDASVDVTDAPTRDGFGRVGGRDLGALRTSPCALGSF